MTEQSKVNIAEDSEKQLSHLRDKIERFQDEISKLKALDFLLAGNQSSEFSEISWLISPVVANLTTIHDDLSQFFCKPGMVFAFPASQTDSADSIRRKS